jgi:hypothetical protein
MHDYIWGIIFRTRKLQLSSRWATQERFKSSTFHRFCDLTCIFKTAFLFLKVVEYYIILSKSSIVSDKDSLYFVTGGWVLFTLVLVYFLFCCFLIYIYKSSIVTALYSYPFHSEMFNILIYIYMTFFGLVNLLGFRY